MLRPGQSIDSRHLELSEEEERLTEAHARFAAGIVAESDDADAEALEHYLKALELDPDNEPLAIEVAPKLIAGRRLEEARAILTRITARPDSSGMAWAWLGLVHALQKDQPAAVAANREAIRRLPGNLNAYQVLARIYLAAGQVAEALAVLDDAAQQPDSATSARFLLNLAETFGAFQQIKDPAVGDLRPRILGLLDRAAAKKPEEPAEQLRLADLYQVLGEGEKALPLYDQLLQSAPDVPGLRERLATIYLRNDNREKAAEQFRAMARNQPTNPLPHYYLGMLAMETRHYDEAIDAFQKLLVLRPEDPTSYFDLAVAQLSHSRPLEALEVLERVRAKFRPSFQLEFYSAAAQMELKKYEAAIGHFTSAEIIANASAPAQLTYSFYFQYGVAYERLKRYDDAAIQFERAIELKADFGEAYNYLGYMWAEQGLNLPRAHELIQKAVELEPDNAAFLDSLAWVLHQMNRTAEALPHQLRAIELSKEPDATLYDHLGDMYQRLGKLPEARQAWEKAQGIEAKPEVEKKLKETGKE